MDVRARDGGLECSRFGSQRQLFAALALVEKAETALSKRKMILCVGVEYHNADGFEKWSPVIEIQNHLHFWRAQAFHAQIHTRACALLRYTLVCTHLYSPCFAKRDLEPVADEKEKGGEGGG